DLSVPLDVRVAGAVANVISTHRSDTLAGIDEIVIQIPPSVQGCSVPVAIRAAGMVSNYTTIPVHDGGGPCSDPYGLSSDALSNLWSGGTERIGVISLTRSNASLGVSLTTDSGNLGFYAYSYDQLVSRRGLTALTTPGACVVLSITSQSGDTSRDTVTGSPLRVGQVSITGPNGTKTIDPSNAGKLGESIQLPVPGLPPGIIPGGSGGLFLDPGSYNISATSGADIGAFSVAFQLPGAVTLSNQPTLPSSLNQMLPRHEGLLFPWE